MRFTRIIRRPAALRRGLAGRRTGLVVLLCLVFPMLCWARVMLRLAARPATLGFRRS